MEKRENVAFAMYNKKKVNLQRFDEAFEWISIYCLVHKVIYNRLVGILVVEKHEY